MVELVDTLVLGTSAARREGSSPFSPTKKVLKSELRRKCAVFSLVARSANQGFFRGGEIFGAAAGCAFLDFRPPLVVFAILELDTIKAE